ncbi:MAG TPA: dipeptide/oligopeptide/nickel ABC transporter ATP-binding protein [Acidimicrobiales bacterium]|nr:dipeptide/oligopeptide/nickel ABC transporter ATP-binding protein [Acidimicrobiales bacterium]
MAGTGKAHLRPGDDVLVTVEDLVVEFPVGRGRTVKAVSGISFDIRSGETLGLVGESGCGKSTSGRAIIQLPRPTSGSVTFGGVHLADLSDEEIRQRRTHIQMIFQDPISSLNPRRTVGDIVAEPLRVWGPSDASEQEAIVDRMLDSVGVDPDTARDKRPHEFSGGQCQRISIARSLVMLTNRGNLHRSRRRSRSRGSRCR